MKTGCLWTLSTSGQKLPTSDMALTQPEAISTYYSFDKQNEKEKQNNV